MFVIYIFGNAEYPNFCKIGYDSNWPKPSEKAKKTIRFEQARSHNPRNILIHGIWEFETKESMKTAEKTIHDALRSYRRTETHGKEWFDLSPVDAIKIAIASRAVGTQPIQTSIPITKDRERPYDDWREPSDLYKGEVYKRILWVFQEDSPENRIKVIHSPLYDTCYKYGFTYNPFPVFLVAAYHHPTSPPGPAMELRSGNIHVENCWQSIISDKIYGPGLEATNVGWLNRNATLDWVREQALSSGLVAYDLLQPKPGCVMPVDAQMSNNIKYGETWLKRVKQA
ncbi:MAG: GIY-YIG nuclease family protein [Trichlorobacter sp.]